MKHFEETPLPSYSGCLARRDELAGQSSESPYCLALRIQLSLCYFHLQYPDLAAGEAYKALLLADAVADESDEYHEPAREAVEECLGRNGRSGDSQNQDQEDNAEGEDSRTDMFVKTVCTPIIYRLLIQSLLLVGCYKSAYTFCSQAESVDKTFKWLPALRENVRKAVAEHYKISAEALDSSDRANPSEWPDHGLVRRELYPWNNHEPDRFPDLDTLNEMMHQIAPKLSVLAVDLPDLTGNADGISKQLGVFADEDIAPGEMVLDETSLLTANNKLQDALCDACSAELPTSSTTISEEPSTVVSCPDCEVVFCSPACLDAAMSSYHPALCDQDVESIAKDVPPTEAADSLYSLLLLRAMAMAETQELHPLQLKEVKYIWADFHSLPAEAHWHPSTLTSPIQTSLPRTLPFSFDHNIRLPLHMLEKMDLDIYTTPSADTWVTNTLYAKFRGTASARLSGLGGRAIRGPEVSAVHPMWCLANHSCDPNVAWEWGGSVKFWAREERVGWKREGESGAGAARESPGIKKGQEVLNHYCDIELPVHERREWARGALGGDCRCARCRWESGEAV